MTQAQQKNFLFIEDWIQTLWNWADEYDISTETFPRDKKQLLELKKLDLRKKNLGTLPKEIGFLVNLEYLNLGSSNLNKLPEEIGNLINLESLYITNNNFNTLPKSIVNLASLFRFKFDPEILLTTKQHKWMDGKPFIRGE